jgi:hypothetical protein
MTINLLISMCCIDAAPLSRHLRRIGIITSSIASKPVNRTANARRSTVEDLGIDHRCLDVAMGQEFLDCSNIGTAFEQVRGERVPECMTVHLLDYPGLKDGFLLSPRV